MLNTTTSRLTEGRARAEGAEETAGGGGAIVAVWGSKGGVGTTSIAVNLAAELAGRCRTALLDLDAGGGDAAGFLDLRPTGGIHELFQEGGGLRNVARAATVHAGHLHVYAQADALDARETLAGDTLLRLFEAMRRAYPVAVADCGGRVEESTLLALSAATRVLLVVTPDVPSVRSTARRLRLLAGLDGFSERLLLVLNRWPGRAATLSIDEIERGLGQRLAAVLPEDRAAARAVSLGCPLGSVDPRAPARRALVALAAGLLPLPPAEPAPRRSWRARIFGG